jgi:hypothetical protein
MLSELLIGEIDYQGFFPDLSVNTIRELEINNCPILGRVFVCIQSCSNRRIAGYVTVVTRLKTDKKTSKIG